MRSEEERSARARGRVRLSPKEWEIRTRYVRRHLDDPYELQRSPLSKLAYVQRLAKKRYPNGLLAAGRALHDLVQECLREMENELGGGSAVARLKHFIRLTSDGTGVTEASRIIGITREHASRTLKRRLIELLSEKMILKISRRRQ